MASQAALPTSFDAAMNADQQSTATPTKLPTSFDDAQAADSASNASASPFTAKNLVQSAAIKPATYVTGTIMDAFGINTTKKVSDSDPNLGLPEATVKAFKDNDLWDAYKKDREDRHAAMVAGIAQPAAQQMPWALQSAFNRGAMAPFIPALQATAEAIGAAGKETGEAISEPYNEKNTPWPMVLPDVFLKTLGKAGNVIAGAMGVGFSGVQGLATAGFEPMVQPLANAMKSLAGDDPRFARLGALPPEVVHSVASEMGGWFAMGAGASLGAEHFARTEAIKSNFPNGQGPWSDTNLYLHSLVQEGVAHGVIGTDEQQYFGLKAKTPQQITDAYLASSALSHSGWTLSDSMKTPEVNVEGLVRVIDPETMARHDALTDILTSMRGQLQIMREERQQINEGPHEQELAELEQNKAGGSKRQKKIAQARIDELTEANKAGIEQARATPSPEEMNLQARFQAVEQKLRDLAPMLSEAYRKAREQIGEKEPEAPKSPPKEEVAAKEETPPVQETPQQKETPPAAPPANPIAEDMEKKLLAAGRPVDEARIAAHLEAEHWKARAERFEGKLGTPEELYKKEKVTVRQGKATTKRGAWNKEANTLTLMKTTADASTFLHETGHRWFDEMLKDAEHEHAPQDLKDDAETLKQWAKFPEKVETKAEKSAYTKAHERVAVGFEKYMREGVAPSHRLAAIFDKFRDWLTTIYKTADKLNSPITPEVRAVFDKWLSAKPERVTVAKERVPGGMLAGVHILDTAAAADADISGIADNVRKEIDGTAKAYNGDIHEALKAAETGNIATPAADAQRSVAEPSASEPGGPGSSAEPGGVTGGGNATAAEGAATAGTAPGSTGGAPAAGAAGAAGATGAESAKPNAENPKSYYLKKDGTPDLDAINYDLYNNTPGWLQNYFNEYAEQHRADAYRGVSSDKETLDSMAALAQASGWSPREIRAMEIGQKGKRLEQLASAQLFKAMTAKILEQVKAVSSSGKMEDVVKFFESNQDYQTVMELFRDQQAYAAEASRNLGIRRAIKSLPGMEDANAAIELFQKLTDRNINDVKRQAEYIDKLGSLGEGKVEKFIKDGSVTPWKRFSNMMLEYYVNNLISGPLTHTWYATGNAIKALWKPLVQLPMAATTGAIREAVTGKQISDRVFFSEIPAQLYGAFKGAQRGIHAAAKAWETGQSPLLPTETVSGHGFGLENRLSASYAGPRQNAISGDITIAGHTVNLDKAGNVINIPSRVVAAIHSFSKSVRYEQEIHGLAARQASKERLTGDDYSARAAELTQNPTEEMMTEATRNSLKELYMAPNEYGKFSQWLVSGVNKFWPLKIIVPFIKIGTQITREAFIESTPLGALIDKDVKAQLAKGGAARDFQIAKANAGIALMAGTTMLVAEGYATGDGPSDPNKRRIWLLNHKPNSIQIGSVTIPYQGLGSLGMLMRFSANMYETASEWNEEDGHKLAAAFFNGFAKSVLDDNFMRGLHDMLDAIYDYQQHGENYLRSFATNWLPFSVGLGQVSRMIDPYHRQVGSLFEQAWSKIPVLSEGLYPQRDVFGVPITNGKLRADYTNDPTVRRMNALNMGTGRLDKSINGVPLTEKQYDDYARIAGRWAKDALDKTINAKGFDQLPKGEQMLVIQKTIDEGRAVARSQMLKLYPELISKAVLAQKKLYLTGQRH